MEFWLDRWVVKDISNYFKVVASRYCDESKRIYKLGKSSPPPPSNKFTTMVANADDDNKLWHFRFSHTNYGSLRYISHLHLVEGLPQINAPNDVYKGCVMGKHQWESFSEGQLKTSS